MANQWYDATNGTYWNTHIAAGTGVSTVGQVNLSGEYINQLMLAQAQAQQLTNQTVRVTPINRKLLLLGE